MHLLVTGGCGFLGAHFIRRWLSRFADDTVTDVDCLTYAGSLDNLEEARDNARHRHLSIDIADAARLDSAFDPHVDLIVHFAAETHVDRSLEDAARFVRTNVLGTQNLLAAAMKHDAPPVIVISSDEVYGPAQNGVVFGSGDPPRPSSPYAASKAAADWLALAHAHAHGLDVTVVRSVNVFGPRQYPEKMIPLFASRALAGEPLPLYGSGRQRRCWLYVDDFIDGLQTVVSNPGRRRQRPVWHLGSPAELENRHIAEKICRLCEADPALIVSVTDRPGHDRRYALDYSETTRVFGWKPRVAFDDGLRRTVDWIRAHQEWCRRRSDWAPHFLRG